MTSSPPVSRQFVNVAIAAHAMPALEPSFYDNVPAMAITPWDPI
jgi:hypothetical protein